MKKRLFGRHEGRSVEEIVLESDAAAVSILNYGCTVRDWRVDSGSRALPMVLGFPSLDDYVGHARAHGAVVGRVANRTAEARFTLDGKQHALSANHGRHHLHGGTVGLGRRVWEMEGDAASGAVLLRYASPDGEEGYPGAVDFSVTYRLEGPRLVCEMAGVPDRVTPINLVQHNYYNLAGGADVRDHVLRVAAKSHTPVDDELIPTGEIKPVAGTHMDFQKPVSFEKSDPERIGLDINLVLDPERDRAAPSAEAHSPWSGLALKLWTGEPGLQVFNAPRMQIAVPGHGNERYGPFCGLCLEAQHYPDSLHNPDWPSVLRSKDDPYFQRLAVEISRAT
ncbi:galactose mutarotase [soil metagenome]